MRRLHGCGCYKKRNTRGRVRPGADRVGAYISMWCLQLPSCPGSKGQSYALGHPASCCMSLPMHVGEVAAGKAMHLHPATHRQAHSQHLHLRPQKPTCLMSLAARLMRGWCATQSRKPPSSASCCPADTPRPPAASAASSPPSPSSRPPAPTPSLNLARCLRLTLPAAPAPAPLPSPKAAGRSPTLLLSLPAPLPPLLPPPAVLLSYGSCCSCVLLCGTMSTTWWLPSLNSPTAGRPTGPRTASLARQRHARGDWGRDGGWEALGDSGAGWALGRDRSEHAAL